MQRQDRTGDRSGATTQGQSKTGAESKTGAQSKSGAETQRQSGTQSPQQQDRAGATTQGQSTTGAATQSQTGGQTGAATQQSQAGTMNQTEANRTTLSTQQQATIRQSVLSASNAPRVNVNSINFAINVGVSVPSHVNAVSVSTFPALIDVFPRYRDDSFFVVEDEIVFLDRDRRVVDVVPAGPRARFSRSSTGGSTAASLNLGEAEIRQVQQVLIERGLLTGEADGVLGSRTEAALVTFQRQQGIQTTGSIDTHTVDALGLSNRIGQRTGQSTTGSSQSSTVGQSQTGTQQQQPSAQQNTTTGPASGQANAPTPQNQSTTGQAGGQQQQPAQQNTQPPTQQNTTGQAAPQNQSTVGQGGNQPGASPNMPSGGQAPSTSGQGTSGQGNMPAQNPGQNPAEK
jgi:peptidoglycan hydrolase-like protein with peptidoglycan-binding domain